MMHVLKMLCIQNNVENGFMIKLNQHNSNMIFPWVIFRKNFSVMSGCKKPGSKQLWLSFNTI